MSYRVVAPIMNRKCAIPNGFPISISSSIGLRKIRGEDLSVVTQRDSAAASYLDGGKFTITIDDFDFECTDQKLQEIMTCTLFSLNTIADNTSLAIENIFVLKSNSTRIARHVRFPGHSQAQATDFKITSRDKIQYVQNLFAAVSIAVAKHAALKLRLGRLNSAIGRSMIDEKIIDLCIALESVFQSNTEISFQFALYNSHLAEANDEKRLEAFQLLKKLYSQRSRIVHGNDDADEAWCVDNFAKLLTIAKASVLQKVEFLNQNDHKAWKNHLESRALGIV